GLAPRMPCKGLRLAKERADSSKEEEDGNKFAISKREAIPQRKFRPLDELFEPPHRLGEFRHFLRNALLIAATGIDMAEELAHWFHHVEIADARKHAHLCQSGGVVRAK